MALVTLNQLLVLSAKGQLGSVVFYPHPFKAGLFVMRGKGKRTKAATDAELENQERFRRAQAYAKAAQNDPRYQAAQKTTHRQAVNIAIANYLNAPVVRDIDLGEYTGAAGQVIRVQADDDFEVTGILIRILDLAGVLLESGSATRAPEGNTTWNYTAQADIPRGQTVVIEATAIDDPGNRAVRKLDHACGPRAV
jgi:hypothetical protein